MNRLRHALDLMREAKSASVPMRRKFIAYWASMLFVLFAAILALASFFGMLSISESNLRHTLDAQHANTVSIVKRQTSVLTAHVIALSQGASNALDVQLIAKPVSALDDDPEGIVKAEKALFSTLRTALEASPCDGAFAIIDATVNTQADRSGASRAGVYIRYANLNVNEAVNQDIVLYRGSPQIARDNSIELHNRWRLEFDTALIPDYESTIRCSSGSASGDCRWTSRVQLTDTWENAVILTAPLYASNGDVRGMCGLELSDLYLGLTYPAQSSEFGSMVTVIAPVNDGVVDVSMGMTGELDATYLSDSDKLYVHEKRGYNLYKGSSGTFIGLQTPLNLKTVNSTDVHVITLMPQEQFNAMVFNDRLKMIVASLLLLVAAIALARYLSLRFVRPISAAVDAAKADGAQMRSTGFSEIDALVAVLDSKASNLKPNLLPPDVASLLDDFSTRFASLTATERKIVGLYAEGMETGDVAECMFISIHTARKHNANIYRKLNVGSRDELVLYLELFRRCKKLDALLGIDENPPSRRA